MALRPGIRFDVFKRDAFTCQYCGRQTPQVVLEVDHIIPRAEGGGDEIENLLTSCWDCNRGKGAGLLDNRAPMAADMEQRADLIRERERQLRVYNDAKREERERKDRDFADAWDHWFSIWGVEEMAKWHTPWESVLRHYIGSLGVEDVKASMDIARARFDYPTGAAPKYLGGVLKRRLAEVEGRLVRCTYCQETIILERGQDTSAGWHHNRCAPAEEPG